MNSNISLLACSVDSDFVLSTRHISAKHDFHTQNHKSRGFYIAAALGREKLCIRLFGGGVDPTTKSDGGFPSSPQDRNRAPSPYLNHSLRITLQGLPTAKLFGGISFVTTLPAPITLSSPIVTPGKIIAPVQIQTLSPIVTG